MAWPEDIAKYKGWYDEGYEPVRQKRYARQLEMGLIDTSYRLSEPTYYDWDSLSEELRKEEASKMEVYAAMIDRLDQNVGRLLKTLELTGREENTLILFVSDNGASAEMVRIDDDYGEIGSMTLWSSLGPQWANVSNTPFRYFKNYSYEGGINTPMIAYWPGNIQPGSFNSFPGHFIDIMATLVDLSGAQYPGVYRDEEITPLQGESFLPALRGEKMARSRPLFWEWSQGQAVRQGDWKLVRWGKEKPWDLYNVAEDPTEIQNLASSFPDRVNSLEILFTEWQMQTVHK
jgi:arylsulfatase